ncbi:MAG: phage holin family protein, partial [bacterium]|nr:phage holin family protein [bacterium]
MKTFIHWVIATLAILIAARIVPGVSVTLVGAIIAAVVLGALNLFIRPILIV